MNTQDLNDRIDAPSATLGVLAPGFIFSARVVAGIALSVREPIAERAAAVLLQVAG